MPRLSKIGAACLAAFGFSSGGSSPALVTANYLVVAGGGGGGGQAGGGGGAGGLLTGTTSLSLTETYTIIVGAGGAGAAASTNNGVIGSNSTAFTLTALGGGYGAGAGKAGGAGGSGGGGSAYGLPAFAGGSGTSGQGYAGGAGNTDNATYNAGGGGGGAGAVGTAALTNNASGAAGGIGVSSSITGTATYYAGGGGGGGNGTQSGVGGVGGNGGGGHGAYGNQTHPLGLTGTSGTANLGGGGGGGASDGYSNLYVGFSGGSGVVIISYAGAQQFGGGIVSSDGTNTIHTFKTSGQLVPINSLSASYLIVAGGASGGNGQTSAANGGGGGAGGVLTGSGKVIDTNSTYLVVVGAGGTGGVGTSVGSGTNSYFSIISTTAIGGGWGGYLSPTQPAGNGGSGGGGGSSVGGSGAFGTGTAGQGNNGGAYGSTSAGGGGGAGAVGGNGSGANGGNGGVGIASSISGTSTYYGGGGGGGADSTAGTGGSGGGGNGSTPYGAATTAGQANTGGGGGGGSSQVSTAGANGGSGIIIISYPGSTQLMAGGTVTIVGGNVIHTFTSSGYLTPLTFVGNSLRFRSTANTYLSRSFPIAGNRKTWTYSAWFKRGALGARQQLFGIAGGSDSLTFFLGIDGSDRIELDGHTLLWRLTSSVYRDPAAWYHLTLAVDTTQSIASNRIKIYINGVEITAFSTSNDPSLNADLGVNQAATHYIGQVGSTIYFDGEMTEVRFVDGQALTPNAFGSFNAYGVWQPINYGGSYGTNGFYLPMSISNAKTYSAGFDMASQYLTITSPASSLVNWYSSNYTLEYWIYPINFTTATNGDSAVIGNLDPASSSDYWSFGTTGSGYINFYYFNGTQKFITANKQLTANTWNHLALVNNGGVVTIYVNGIASGSAAIIGTPQSSSSLPLSIGKNSNTYFSGYLSNIRIVNAAVYTSNFVPQTEPLTAIANTSLLTLQSGTIIDNSVNAFTINNFGTTSTAITCPFISNTGYDKGPSGNNFSINNFGAQRGRDIDSMSDVPTLTSSTSANYAVMNPLDGGHSFGNANLYWYSGAAAWKTARATIAVSSGKWYWEVTGTNIVSGSSFVINGIDNYSLNPSSGYPGSTSTSYGYFSDTGTKFPSNSAYGASYGNNDVIGVALDLNAGTLTFYKNGVSQGIAFTGISGTYTPAIGEYGSIISVNFGQIPFSYTPPSGHVALNTYNL